MTLLDNRPVPPAAYGLAAGAALPFWLGVLLLWSHSDPIGPLSAVNLLIYYGGLLLGFLGGIRWGAALGPYETGRQAREMLLAAIPLAIAAAAIVLPPLLGVSALIAAYLTVALWDVTAVEDRRLPAWFAPFRLILTALTVPPQLAALGWLAFAA